MVSLSVIICTRGRPRDLAATLDSLTPIAVPPDSTAELVVVENSPQREAEALVCGYRHPAMSVRYVMEPAPGKSHALNRAVRETSSEVLVFTDDDVRFPPRWLEGITEPIRTGRADAVAGGVRLAPHLLRPWMNHTHRAWLASTRDYLSAQDPSEMCGANMAVTRRALTAAGEYDTELGPGITNGGEETLLSWKLRRAGFRLVGALDVEVEHHLDPRRLQYGSWVRTARLQGQTRAYLMHHWSHDRLSFPALCGLYFEAKLALRRLVTRRRRPEEEGIEPWELSYVQDAARAASYRRERRRASKYAAPARPLS